ncbi:ATPase [Vibrio sinaloensis]|uniref:hypothetical protein n=1 Tax=Photobacterium sp. (strain ATCC 43367) TaxID=379097 RepID=UPI000580A19D|nr:hypothetical protein [Vibrio sinaloensis]KIE22298.1 ATPase [Vibrio sinaloensis]
MKKQIVASALFMVLAGGVTTLVVAGNSAFPPVDDRVAEAEQQMPRFFVKYYPEKERQARTLLQQHQLEIVETLSKQEVFVVKGSKDKLDQLISSEFIDYIEPEPIRSLYSQ